MKKAFTMIEFLVVVAIVSILAAILFPFIFRGKSFDEFEGCINHKVVTSAHTSYGTEYVYECEDGRQIASTRRPQSFNQ